MVAAAIKVGAASIPLTCRSGRLCVAVDRDGLSAAAAFDRGAVISKGRATVRAVHRQRKHQRAAIAIACRTRAERLTVVVASAQNRDRTSGFRNGGADVVSEGALTPVEMAGSADTAI